MERKSIDWINVAGQLVLVDLLQYLAHRLEHIAPTWAYVASHKPHHKHTEPHLFQAFDGSVADTVLMILVPLLGTSLAMSALRRQVTVWEYMAFGSLYSSHLCLIHSNTPHRFELLHKCLGIGTSWDHHVHHSMFRWNYGHLFMWWDWAGGTYREGGDRFNKVVVG
jgi:alternative squalene epoxidase